MLLALILSLGDWTRTGHYLATYLDECSAQVSYFLRSTLSSLVVGEVVWNIGEHKLNFFFVLF